MSSHSTCASCSAPPCVPSSSAGPRRPSRLVVTRGAVVEVSRGATPRVVFRPEDVSAEKWIVPGWAYIALPTAEMFRMPFAEQLGLMRKALKSIHRRTPDVEKVLRSGGRQALNSLELDTP
ncbi:hypothetical protein BJY52DRAFT_1209519 [Lactarius psammicola]|nr:hypothetical protein BJY52DRAFT_1209519 [Lactarius psammicola]